MILSKEKPKIVCQTLRIPLLNVQSNEISLVVGGSDRFPFGAGKSPTDRLMLELT